MSGHDGFALWVTGIPASGKSSVTGELVKLLRQRRVPVVVLESDEMRKVLTPDPVYSDEERDLFYRQLAGIGSLITRSSVNVIFDATANKRVYRDHARKLITRFLEVQVTCPLEVCRARDPKGIYRMAGRDTAGNVPGIQAPYEPPLKPELTVDGQKSPVVNAEIILVKLKQLLYI